MSEIIISPGVDVTENDQTFNFQQPAQADVAIIGPTVRGKINIPTIVTSYEDYIQKYGDDFLSGSSNYNYFTSLATYNFFQNLGDAPGSVLITRVVSGSTVTDWTPATSSRIETSFTEIQASASVPFTPFFPSSSFFISQGASSDNLTGTFSINGITLVITGSAHNSSYSGNFTNTSTLIYVPSGSNVANTVISASEHLAASSSLPAYSSSLGNISSSADTNNLLLTYIGQNSAGIGNNQVFTSGSTASGNITYTFSGGVNTEAFVLETISEGEIMNSEGPTGPDGTLLSGSENNYRYQITSPNVEDGTFNLLIRKGNDTTTFPSVLHTIGPISLDPNSSNYIEKVIGNQIHTLTQDSTTSEYFIQTTGNYPNRYPTIRVKQVNATTVDYFNNDGTVKSEYTSSMPLTQSGVFGGALGNNIPTNAAGNYYENITDSNIQGLSPSNYSESISLLSNKDAYRYNTIITPGLIADPNFYPNSNIIVSQLISMVENRGDCMAIIDISKYNENTGQIIANAQTRNTSYAATYWPWVQTPLPNNLSTLVWAPTSTFIPGVYAFNDSNGYPWLAPAGINRGIISNATQTEKVLTQGIRDTLYQNRINPVTTFITPQGNSIVVFGQKTLQKRNTSLTRINVRRLLINLKNYISRVANEFVFEQNTPETREDFLSQINPYLSLVQQQEGLTAFEVIMDETNNTPEIIDNNKLVGQIYIQPTRTAEFILLNFNILPTGAEFPS